MAADQFCETTIAFSGSKEVGSMFKRAFQTDNFRVSVVRDVHGTEMCGALKNIVACGAGFVDGLKLGDNTKVLLKLDYTVTAIPLLLSISHHQCLLILAFYSFQRPRSSASASWK